MTALVQKWGNSLALRIPSSLAKTFSLLKGSEVDVSVVDDKIIIHPKKTKKYSLAQMLKKISKKNRHVETDFGKPLGNEVW